MAVQVKAEVNDVGVFVLTLDLKGLDFILIRRLVKAVGDLVGDAYPTPTWTDEAAVLKYLTAMTPAEATVIATASQLLSNAKPPTPPGPGPNPNI